MVLILGHGLQLSSLSKHGDSDEEKSKMSSVVYFAIIMIPSNINNIHYTLKYDIQWDKQVMKFYVQ